MLILCNGMQRSGSTWSFNVINGLMRRCFPGAEIAAAYSEKVVEFLKASHKEATHAVIKCHYLTPFAKVLVRMGAAKAVYTWREPADAAVSAMNMFGISFDDALGVLEQAMELYEFHRAMPQSVIVSYQELTRCPEAAVARIARHLQLPGLTPGMAAEVTEETSFEQMRSKTEKLTPGARPDPRTMLHHRHIRDGSSGYGRRALSVEQAQRIDELLGQHPLFGR